ncbi:MAG TPA: Uma2 family endonuclease [Planctomycetota bacterium]|nr:Uma2 family endonuclease [Planctomycetota bacterium]
MKPVIDCDDFYQLRNFRSKAGEPPLEILEFLPTQGNWTEEEYMLLIEKYGIEYTDGFLEILPPVTSWHQQTIMFLLSELERFYKNGVGGNSCFYGLRVKLPNSKLTKYREPDIIYVSDEHKSWTGNTFWSGADLVMEVVLPKGRKRDLVTKRADYAEARIPEYWIVDPKHECIAVLKLQGTEYIDHGIYKKGERAVSALLKGFSVDVTTAVKMEF